MKTLFSYLSNTSEFTRIILALQVGVISKLFSAGAMMTIYYLQRINHLPERILDSPASAIMKVENGHYMWTYSVGDFVTILVLSPLIENLFIPLIFWMCHKFKTSIIPISVITVMAYLTHFGGSFGITGAAGFFVFSVYFAFLKNSYTTWRAYYYTVIAHFSANVTSLIASLVL